MDASTGNFFPVGGDSGNIRRMGSELGDYLRPMPIAGEALRFDLSAYRSTVTREMAQLRLRVTAQVFMVDRQLIAANLGEGGAVLEVDAGALATANAEVRRRLDAGPDWPVTYVRPFAVTGAMLDQVARTVESSLARGARPRPDSLVVYMLTSAHYQAMGGLKFCVPDTLRPRVSRAVDDPALVDALLAPDGPTLWAELRFQEAGLGHLRRHGPHDRYRRRLARHRRHYGYLYAEDVDFRQHETLDALDERIAAVPATERRRLTQARTAVQAAKREARRRFAEAAPDATLVSHVLLARALTEHEDLNRRAKMRLLRDLRDLADLAGVDIERDGIAAFTDAEQPVLRSS